MNKEKVIDKFADWLREFDDTFDFDIESSNGFKMLPAVFKVATGRKFVKGILTYDNSNNQKEVSLEYYIKKDDDGRKWLFLKDGVTGYESVCLDKFKEFARDDVIEQISEYGWMACIGGIGYASLFISGKEMKKVFVKEGLI